MNLNKRSTAGLLLVLLLACKAETQKSDLYKTSTSITDIFRIDERLKEQTDALMEGQPEIFTFDDAFKSDSVYNRKKSSIVKILILRDEINEIRMTDKLRCVANLKNNLLNIDISDNTGFAGIAVAIKYSEGRVSTNIKEFYDNYDPNEKKPQVTVEKQILSLNKSKFSIGDSLYGHIYARIVNANKVRYYAQGFFRAKISAVE